MTRTFFALGFFLLAGAIFLWYTRPTYDTVKVQQAQIARYDEALTKAAELQELKQSLLARYNSFDPNQVARLQKFLPDNVDNIGLILDLNNLASQHGMSLENVDVSGGGPTNPTSAPTTIGATPLKYDSITLRFTTHSTYANFEQFLRDVESSLRIADLVSLSITGSGAAGSSASRIYQYQIALRTYWLK